MLNDFWFQHSKSQSGLEKVKDLLLIDCFFLLTLTHKIINGEVREKCTFLYEMLSHTHKASGVSPLFKVVKHLKIEDLTSLLRVVLYDRKPTVVEVFTGVILI